MLFVYCVCLSGLVGTDVLKSSFFLDTVDLSWEGGGIGAGQAFSIWYIAQALQCRKYHVLKIAL